MTDFIQINGTIVEINNPQGFQLESIASTLVGKKTNHCIVGDKLISIKQLDDPHHPDWYYICVEKINDRYNFVHRILSTVVSSEELSMLYIKIEAMIYCMKEEQDEYLCRIEDTYKPWEDSDLFKKHDE